MPVLTYATRRSPLALAQSRAFAQQLCAAIGTKPEPTATRELQIVTSGDTIQDRSLAEIGGKGLFVKEIEEALLAKKADFAVHSLKDLPGVLPQGLVLACIPKREDPRDALVAPRYGSVDSLPPGARVGTSSLRRSIAMRAMRPDLVVQMMRGNVDTRLRKVDEGQVDAIVLARAGLIRLGLEARATQVLSAGASLPAPGQGALAIECRTEDAATRALLSTMHDAGSAICVAAERGVLIALGGDCKTPLGAYAAKESDRLRLRAFVAEVDGSRVRKAERTVDWPATDAEAHEIGLALGHTLLA
jgi:hydroxymethylbilane synthase